MSQDNVEVVRRALAALDRRDVEAYLEVASPQIELITPACHFKGRSPGMKGRDFFRELWSFSEASEFQVEEIRAVEGRVLAFFILTTTGRQGIQTSAQVAGVYDFEDGKIRRAHTLTEGETEGEPLGATPALVSGCGTSSSLGRSSSSTRSRSETSVIGRCWIGARVSRRQDLSSARLS